MRMRMRLQIGAEVNTESAQDALSALTKAVEETELYTDDTLQLAHDLARTMGFFRPERKSLIAIHAVIARSIPKKSEPSLVTVQHTTTWT